MSTTINFKNKKNNYNTNKERKIRNRKYAKDRVYRTGGAGSLFLCGGIPHNSQEYKNQRVYKYGMVIFEDERARIIP